MTRKLMWLNALARKLSMIAAANNKERMMNKFPVLRFAVAAGIFISLHAVIITVCAIAGVPGMRPFAEWLTQFYGPYGYSISAAGIVAGAILGFFEGFVHFGIFGLIYRWLPIPR